MNRGRTLAAGLLVKGILLSTAAFSQTLIITAPANNTATSPGSKVNFTVTMSPVTDFAAVSLYGSTPLGLIGAQAAAASVTFSLTLPANLKSASYPVTAIGYATSGALVVSQPVTLQVGAAGVPSKLSVTPSQLVFTSIGSQLPVLAGGVMANGAIENVTESPSMSWTAGSSAVARVSTDGLVTSVGNGTTTVSANFDGFSASATVTVNAPASPCTYSLSSTSANVGSGGGTASANVTTNAPACEWSSASSAPWISVIAGTLSSGSGPVTLAVAANSGTARTATVSIAGQNFGITQAGGATTVAPAIVNSGVVNGASFVTGGIVPGEIATVFGTNLTTATGINLASALPLATELQNVQVLVNGTAAPIFAVDNVNGQQQINFQVPYEVGLFTTATIAVVNNSFFGNTITVPVIAAQPGIFTYTVGTTAFGAILHADYTLANTASPAVAGETVQIYCTGLGAVTPAPTDGVAAAGASMTVAATTVTIGGAQAAVAYSGLAPGFVGLYQVNATVPSGLTSGNQSVIITIGGTRSAIALLPIM